MPTNIFGIWRNMLKLKNISKYYKDGTKKRLILDNINLDFRCKELVFILGSSGSGKSTLLNIIAGNLKSDSGDIYVDSECITKYNDKHLNYYRNKTIGYIYQDYNLLDYLDVIDNIMLGYNNGLDKDSIKTLLKQLDLYEKRYTKVSVLSGGEKQRVAIARALINNPDIILADEPTGALDYSNSIKIMDILKRISKNKLVIIVSHDNNLANKYGDRLLYLQDGKMTYEMLSDEGNFKKIAKSKIKKINLINLALKNIMLKKGRTFLTSLAISLGIVTMTIVMCLSNNFNQEIVNLEKDIVSVLPITIRNDTYYEETKEETLGKSDDILIKDTTIKSHQNKINQNYLNYLNNIKEINSIVYNYDILMPFISDSYKIINNTHMKQIPSKKYINDNYEVIYGKNIENENEILLVLDKDNGLDKEIVDYFNLNSENKHLLYKELIGRKVKVIPNDLYYLQDNNNLYYNDNYQKMFEESNVELKIVGIIKEKEENVNKSFIYYSSTVTKKIIDINCNSKIVKLILEKDTNYIMEKNNKEETLSYLGYNSIPNQIDIYVDTIKDKETLIKKLDDYNKNNDKLLYEDIMSSTIDIVKNFVNIISVILLIFTIVSIIVSLFMVSILTNIRVVERKKEIGILRGLGASRKDIRLLFNTENVMIGIISSIISIIIVILLKPTINSILYKLVKIDNMLVINYYLVIAICIINIIIIKLSGSIPSIKASRLGITKCIYNK